MAQTDFRMGTCSIACCTLHRCGALLPFLQVFFHELCSCHLSSPVQLLRLAYKLSLSDIHTYALGWLVLVSPPAGHVSRALQVCSTLQTWALL